MIYGILFAQGLKVLIVSIVALLALLAMRRVSASKRNVVAVASLVGLLFLPVISIYSPAKPIQAPAIASIPMTYVERPADGAAAIAASTHANVKTQEALTTVGFQGREALVILWLVIVALLLGRLVTGLVMARRWALRATHLEDGVAISSHVTVPMTVWSAGATILLPVDAKIWDDDRLQNVLAHERSHIVRGDLLWNLLGHIVCAVYWPLPTVWAIRKIAHDSSERACDDRVLGSGVLASDYAQDLLTIARDLTKIPVAGLPMAAKSELGTRIAHVLDKKIRRGVAGFGAVLVTGVGAALVCIPVAAIGIVALPIVAPQVKVPTIATPGSKAGAPENSFVGTMADGRKIELIQVQHKGANGFEAWKPDGMRISHPITYGQRYWLSRADAVELVFSMQTKSQDPRMQAYDTFGQIFPKEKPSRIHANGIVLPGDESGYRIAIARPLLANPGSARTSLTFIYGTYDYSMVGVVSPRDKQTIISTRPHSGIDASSIVVHDRDSEELAQRDEKGVPKYDKYHHPLMHIAQGWSFDVIVKGHSPTEMNYVIHDKKKKSHFPALRNYGYIDGNPSKGFRQVVFVEIPKKDVQDVEIQEREGQAVEFNHVVVRPDLLK